MRFLFDPESQIMQILSRFCDIVILNLVFLLTCIPIFTIGASTAAFYRFTLDAVQDNEGKILHTYFGAFRSCFRKATVLWLLQVVLSVFLGINIFAAWQLYLAKGILGLGMLSLSASGLLIFLGTCIYLYPITVSYDFSIKKTITDSFIMAVGNPHVTLSVLILFAIAGVLTYYLSGLFFFWLGLAVFFSSYFIWGLFLKYSGVKIEKKKKKKKLPDPNL